VTFCRGHTGNKFWFSNAIPVNHLPSIDSGKLSGRETVRSLVRISVMAGSRGVGLRSDKKERPGRPKGLRGAIQLKNCKMDGWTKTEELRGETEGAEETVKHGATSLG